MSTMEVDLIRCKWCHKTTERSKVETPPWILLSGWGLAKGTDLIGYYCCLDHLFDAIFEFWVVNKVKNRWRLLRYSNEHGDLLHGTIAKCDACLFQVNFITGSKSVWFSLEGQDFCSVKCLLKSLLDTRGEELIDSGSEG